MQISQYLHFNYCTRFSRCQYVHQSSPTVAMGIYFHEQVLKPSRCWNYCHFCISWQSVRNIKKMTTEPVFIRYTYHHHIHHLLVAFCHTYFHAQLHNNPLFLLLVYHMVLVAVPAIFLVDHKILWSHSCCSWRSQYTYLKMF